jgi:hypothetical protein
MPTISPWRGLLCTGGPPQPYWAVPVRLSDEAKASRERREPCCGGLGERRPTRPGRRQKMTEHSPMPRD